ncbi:MAG: 4a-hydroxytetrahydrobiopterin dehydratase [Bradymonadaceae bacterium]|nr:4a-hydroxytetrahydrobiopterin dehydratase [Lujinxingiaceae bacterium]
MSTPRLSEDQINNTLAQLPDWSRDGDAIVRKLKFPSFFEAITFITRIARHAEAADHHPEIFNVYDKVELRLTTHDASGLTQKDFDLAAQIDAEV